MAKFSKVNLQNQVIMVEEFDHIGQAEFMYGGNWIDYHLSSTEGIVGLTYDPIHNIFKEPIPIDIVGVACSSWTLNTQTGKYTPPISFPQITNDQDDAGYSYYWNEAEYQADNSKGWVLTTK